jgi:hypothetical protein
MSHLTKIEQETVITFNAAEKTADIHYRVPVNCISFRKGKIGLMDDLDEPLDADAVQARNVKTLHCPTCPKTFASKQGLKGHHLREHGKELPS